MSAIVLLFTDFLFACPPPPCPPCHVWVSPNCVYQCASSRCEECTSGSCRVCGGREKEVCCGTSIPGYRECCREDLCYRCQGDQCKYICKPEQCETCVDNECKVCGGDPRYVCCQGGCCTCCENNICSYGCYVLQKVPFTVIQSCPDCDWYYGCQGTQITVDEHWVWRQAQPGESGRCIPAFKEEMITVHALCKADWNITAILRCLGDTGACVSACSGDSWLACVSCLLVHAIDCGGGWCAFIEACGPSSDPDDIQFVSVTVADPDHAGNFCRK